MDGSVLEIFTNSGETLTTRVYRGYPPAASTTDALAAAAAAAAAPAAALALATSSTPAATAVPAAGLTTADDAAAAAANAVFSPAGIEVFAAGGGSKLIRLDAWEMGSAWVDGGVPGESHLKLSEGGVYHGDSVVQENWYGSTWGDK